MISLSQPLPFLGLAFSRQIRLIESCISPNTLVAPIIKVVKSNNRSKTAFGRKCGIAYGFLYLYRRIRSYQAGYLAIELSLHGLVSIKYIADPKHDNDKPRQ